LLMLAGWALMLVSHDVDQCEKEFGLAAIPKGLRKAERLPAGCRIDNGYDGWIIFGSLSAVANAASARFKPEIVVCNPCTLTKHRWFDNIPAVQV
jgi:hypothetical protein